MNFSEYKHKRVVVTGCSSGIGLAVATELVALGAEVIGMSRRAPQIQLAAFRSLDLGSSRSVEDAAAGVEGTVDALFNCAGAPPTVSSAELVKVNFLGTRLLTERLIGVMADGGAIASVTSSNTWNWRSRLATVREFVATETFEEGVAWYGEHEHVAGHGYPFSKEALSVWTMQQSAALVARGIRINATSPGAVQTPLLEESEKVFPTEFLNSVERPSGRRSRVSEQVGPLLFLNSECATYVTGAELAVDGGYSALQTMQDVTS